MKLVLLTSATMLAFAMNSILTRMAIGPGHIDAMSFAVIRVLAGAIFLSALVLGKGAPIHWRGPGRIAGAIGLCLYMAGFSIAYTVLDAGLGALILFGVVQMGIFSFGVLRGTTPSPRQIAGACVAFAGLAVALWPEEGAGRSVLGAGFMVLAGLGWVAYTLSGRQARNPLAETAANFAVCLPILVVLAVPWLEHVTVIGLALALFCGSVTSGLGYALWYRVLPHLQANTAAVVQLSVPILAILMGAAFLGETIRFSVLVAAGLVLSGIALAVTKPRLPKDRRPAR